MSEIRVNVGVGEIRIAELIDGRLEALTIERGFDRRAAAGDIVLGRVQKVMPALEAAFVEIGQDRAGFLALRDAAALARKQNPAISDCVREGEAVLLQLAKEAYGEKGARLTAALTLAGPHLVLAPGRPGISLSRRIDDESGRSRLFALGEDLQAAYPGHGFILRTEAASADAAQLRAEARVLAERWQALQAAAKSQKPPATLYAEPGPLARLLRDRLGRDVTRIAIDDALAAEQARDFCREALPGAEAKIHTVPPLFDDELEEEIAALAGTVVALPSGGLITIEPTKALTAIDVDSAGFVASGGRDQTALAVNLEAAREIGRQLRLRGIGGLIVIDFIQLSDSRQGEAVVAALRQSLALDRVPVDISPMADFGIVAIARKRMRPPLSGLTSTPCPACDGGGVVASAQTLALAALRHIEREARANPGREILLLAAPSVLDWLTAHEDDVRAGLMRRGAGRVRFQAGGLAEGFDVAIV